MLHVLVEVFHLLLCIHNQCYNLFNYKAIYIYLYMHMLEYILKIKYKILEFVEKIERLKLKKSGH